MPKTNPDIHIICGKCGCATEFVFKLSLNAKEFVKDENKLQPAVYLSCGNCATLTDLSEVVKDNTDWEKLKLVN